MVYYVRLLRTPQVSDVPKKGYSVSAVAVVTTDLGDSFFGQDLQLIARLTDATTTGEVLATQNLQWQGSSRALKLTLTCPAKYASRLTRLHITTQDTITAHSHCRVPAILDVWSDRFSLHNGTNAEPVVERVLHLPGRSRLGQWEETGDSIARHIWDASLGFLVLFRQIFGQSKEQLQPQPQHLPLLQRQLLDSPTSRSRVLEVGAGCGIVGIALAQLRKSEVVLTDLEDAQDILQSNIGCATVLAGSTVQRQVLEWGPSLEALADPRFDLVLVSDCIYNPDSSLSLVETLLQICNHNPNVSILVGFKRRHDADDIFFDRMRTAGFTVAESCKIILPHVMTDHDATEPEVEMFVYKAPPPMNL